MDGPRHDVVPAMPEQSQASANACTTALVGKLSPAYSPSFPPLLANIRRMDSRLAASWYSTGL